MRSDPVPGSREFAAAGVWAAGRWWWWWGVSMRISDVSMRSTTVVDQLPQSVHLLVLLRQPPAQRCGVVLALGQRDADRYRFCFLDRGIQGGTTLSLLRRSDAARCIDQGIGDLGWCRVLWLVEDVAGEPLQAVGIG